MMHRIRQIKHAIILVMVLYTSLTFANPQYAINGSVEYLKICDIYDNGWYYIPGTDTCLSPSTGETVQLTSSGIVMGQSQLAWRVSQLEQQLSELIADKSEKDLPQKIANKESKFVDYTKICSIFGAGWYYIPNSSDTCIFETTGETRQLTSSGTTVRGQSKLAWRVAKLEQRIALAENK